VRDFFGIMKRRLRPTAHVDRNVARVATCAVGAVLVVVSLSACDDGDPGAGTVTASTEAEVSSPSPRPAGEHSGYDGFLGEYEEAAGNLDASLPDGWHIESEPQGDWDPDGQYETGAGEMQAAFAWQCAWIDEYEVAKAAADEPRIQHTLDQLATWTSLDEVAPHIDEASTRTWAEEVISPARSGDDGFLLDLAESCPEP
jgi:hypothetical protein